jgi:hypothetical protein
MSRDLTLSVRFLVYKFPPSRKKGSFCVTLAFFALFAFLHTQCCKHKSIDAIFFLHHYFNTGICVVLTRTTFFLCTRKWITKIVTFPHVRGNAWLCVSSFQKYPFFVYFFGGLVWVGHSFAYVAHLWFLRDVWIRTQSAAVASGCATNFATNPYT